AAVTSWCRGPWSLRARRLLSVFACAPSEPQGPCLPAGPPELLLGLVGHEETVHMNTLQSGSGTCNPNFGCDLASEAARRRRPYGVELTGVSSSCRPTGGRPAIPGLCLMPRPVTRQSHGPADQIGLDRRQGRKGVEDGIDRVGARR